MSSRTFKGIAVSPGFAIGKVTIFQHHDEQVMVRHDVDVDDEQYRFKNAIRQALQEMDETILRARQRLSQEDAQIFEAHKLVLEDPEFYDTILNLILVEKINAEAALQNVSQQLVEIFENMENEYFRQRAIDIKDISSRVMKILHGQEVKDSTESLDQFILMAHDLTPSDTLNLDARGVLAFVTETGGRTSHTAIVSKSLGIPAIVGVADLIQSIEMGSQVIVDGNEGKVIVNPSMDEMEEYEQKIRAYQQTLMAQAALKDEPTISSDGLKVEIGANISSLDDLDNALTYGAEGIGLFRTEFLFMNRESAPDEEEQFEVYRTVVSAMKGKPVIIRTLDIGGDKMITYLDLPHESNPFLGYRAIRLTLDRVDLFETQLRAILRASRYGRVKVMYPMISNLTEVRQANAILQNAKQQLIENHIPFNPQLEVGIMIEIPAAAIMADALAKEVDFFSLGTNDLIQYTMACDRLNEKISYLYQPYHPSLLRLIKWVIDAAHTRGKSVGLCGEMAGDPIAIPLLLGMGLDEFSVSPSLILPTRSIIRKLNSISMKELVDQALTLEDEEQVKGIVAKNLSL